MEDPTNYYRYWRPAIILISAGMRPEKKFEVPGGEFTLYYPPNKLGAPIRLLLGKNVENIKHYASGRLALYADAMVRMKKGVYDRGDEYLEIRVIRPEGFRLNASRFMLSVLSLPMDYGVFPARHVVLNRLWDGERYVVVATPFGEETFIRHIYGDHVVNTPLWRKGYMLFFRRRIVEPKGLNSKRYK